MKRKVVIDLITAHYENNPTKFFNATLEVLKEFKAENCEELIDFVQWNILPRLKVIPKREEDNYTREITQKDYDSIIDGWNLVPQETK